MRSPEVDALFNNFRPGAFQDDTNHIPQENAAGNGNTQPQGFLADNSVSSDVIQTGAVIAGKIQAGAITTDKLAANAVTAAKITAGTITSNEIAANTITASNIAANTITANEVAANSMTANEIAANAITASEIAADAVTTNKILAGNVTASKMVVDISGKTFGANDGSGASPGYYFGSSAASGMYWNSAFLGSVFFSIANNDSMALYGAGDTTIQGGHNLFPSNSSSTCGTSVNKWATIYATNGTINTSDRNEKRDIQDSPLGLDFIRSLKPRVFRWRETSDTQAQDSIKDTSAEASSEMAPHVAAIKDAVAQMQEPQADEAHWQRIVGDHRAAIAAIQERHLRPHRAAIGKMRPGKRYHYGLIAQEVRASLDEAGVDAAFWQKDTKTGLQSLSYAELTSPIIRAIQEQQAQIETLKSEVAELRNQA